MDTAHSPQVELVPFQLRRYLDYCAELLSLTGKVASLYLSRFEDSTAVAAVNEIEGLPADATPSNWPT